MHIIDGIFAVTILVGCFYGVIVGPFVALFSMLGVIFAGPILYIFHPYVFIHLPEYETDLVAHLIYFPLGYLLLIFGFKALALKLDALTQKLWPGGKRIWGGFVGSILACLFCISLVLLSYPFVKEFSKYSFTESKLWNLTDSICSDRPEYYLKLREFVLLDDFKLAMDSAGKNTISNISNDSEKDSGQLELDNKSMEVSMEKVLSDQEESTAKQKLLYEFLQKYLVKYTQSASATGKSST